MASEHLKSSSGQDKKEIAIASGVEKLNPFADLSLINSYSQAFGLNPDFVYTDVSFDTVINFSWLWKEQAEYNERYQEIKTMMAESAAKHG